MQIEILHRPGNSAAKLRMDPAETCTAEGGAMIAMSGDMDIQTTTHKKGQGGVFKALKRMLSGESFFLNHYTAGGGGGDTTPPTVTAFTLPATSTSPIPVTTFTATDDTGVTGYMITESATPPTAGAAGWMASAPTSVSTGATGNVTFYAWAKDAAGNVSTSLNDTVDVTGGGGGGGLPDIDPAGT